MAFEVQMAAGATLSGLAPHSLTGFERGQPWDGSDLLTKHASHIDLQTIPITALIPPVPHPLRTPQEHIAVLRVSSRPFDNPAATTTLSCNCPRAKITDCFPPRAQNVIVPCRCDRIPSTTFPRRISSLAR